MDPDLIPLVYIVIGAPVLGLVARFALAPLVRELAGAVRGVGSRSDRVADHEGRLTRVEEQLHEQNEQVGRLLDAEQFRQELEAGPPDERH